MSLAQPTFATGMPIARQTVVLNQIKANNEVAGWSFRIMGAVEADTFSGVIHLGSLDDGRDWFVVSLEISNTKDENQEIHSYRIQLHSGDEYIKQTGIESKETAAEINYVSIGGSGAYEVPAEETINVLQVFKVDPSLNDLLLVFDFNGAWTFVPRQ